MIFSVVVAALVSSVKGEFPMLKWQEVERNLCEIKFGTS